MSSYLMLTHNINKTYTIKKCKYFWFHQFPIFYAEGTGRQYMPLKLSLWRRQLLTKMNYCLESRISIVFSDNECGVATNCKSIKTLSPHSWYSLGEPKASWFKGWSSCIWGYFGDRASEKNVVLLFLEQGRGASRTPKISQMESSVTIVNG